MARIQPPTMFSAGHDDGTDRRAARRVVDDPTAVDTRPLVFPEDTATPSGLLSFTDEATVRHARIDEDPTLVDLVVLPR